MTIHTFSVFRRFNQKEVKALCQCGWISDELPDSEAAMAAWSIHTDCESFGQMEAKE